MSDLAPDPRETPEGTVFIPSGDRAVFPTPDHEYAGGVSVTDAVTDEILADPEGGAVEVRQIEWEWTGETVKTRVGESKLIRIEQTSFGKTRTVEVSIVDLADANAEVVAR